jgi:hypothetical protein
MTELPIEQKISKWKEEIERDKTDKARLEGENTSINRRIKEEFGCATISDAIDKVEAMKVSTEKLRLQLEQKVADYERLYKSTQA